MPYKVISRRGRSEARRNRVSPEERQRQVLYTLAQLGGRVRAAVVAAELGTSYGYALSVLDGLECEGRVCSERVGAGRVWWVG